MSSIPSRRSTRSGWWTSSCAASPPADLLTGGRVRRGHLGAWPAPGACYGTWRMGLTNRRPPGSRPVKERRREDPGVSPMATYQMVYGDDEQVVRETYENITGVEHEDGWLVLFRGPEAILRVQEAHVQSLELLNA